MILCDINPGFQGYVSRIPLVYPDAICLLHGQARLVPHALFFCNDRFFHLMSLCDKDQHWSIFFSLEYLSIRSSSVLRNGGRCQLGNTTRARIMQHPSRLPAG